MLRRFYSQAPFNYTTPYTGLSYNLRVGTRPGLSDILAPMSCAGTCGISGDGYRQILALGAAYQGLTAKLCNLPSGTYFWSVQAVDHTCAGSPWASEGSFYFLAKYELSVNLIGNGSGGVTSDPAGGDYPLKTALQAIDAGIDAGVYEDKEGTARPMGAGFDIGAFEYIFNLLPGNYFPIIFK